MIAEVSRICGSAARVKEYIKEHGAENLFGEMEFQAFGLANGHAQTLALARRQLPEIFERFPLNMVAYIAAIECEFREININNPWLGPQERAEFDRFLSRQDQDVVRRAQQLVKERWLDAKLVQWRKDWRDVSFPVLWHALKPGAMRRILGKLTRLGLRRLARPAAADSSPGARPGMRADFHGGMVTVYCDSFGGKDGLDMARHLDEVVVAFDRQEEAHLVEFYAGGYMLGARRLETAAARAALGSASTSASIELRRTAERTGQSQRL